MKKIIILLVTCFSITGYSQNFINESKLWSTLMIDASFSPNHMDTTLNTFYTKFIGDTTINTQIYSKLHQSFDSTLTWGFSHLLREENQKVFIRSTTLETDLLLYDFSIETGDTGYVTNTYNNIISNDSLKFIVDSTDIYFFSSIEFKRLYIRLQLDNEEIQDVWIDGIGSTYGPLRPNCIELIGCYNTWELLCMHNSSDLIFENQNYNACYIVDTLFGIKEQDIIENIFLYPNPINNFGYINTSSKYQDLTMNIYNLLGEKVKTFIVQSKSINEFQFSDIPEGLFIYDIISDARIVSTGKFVISR